MSGDNDGRIVANGKEQVIALPCTVTEFLARWGWKPTQVVVERNGEVLAKTDFHSTSLADGDQLEIIIPVAGG